VLVGPPVDLIVADLSFISLTAVADALLAVAAPHATLLLMVKPQFEAPRAAVPRGGVVRDAGTWVEAMRQVADGYRARGCVLAGAAASPLTGPKGNREFFLHMLRHGSERGDDVIERAAREAP
jgi:23S rRNA (cytidine1920-2'-O)/16S rRNA (cytidine1409-2'-O)-methyltransferase